MVTALADDVWWMDLGGVNAYLVDDEDPSGERALTLVDAGMPWTTSDLVDGVVEAGFKLADLDRVLVTHYDLDHVGGLPRLEGLDVTVYAGGDAPFVAGEDSPDWTTLKGFSQGVGSVISNAPLLPVEQLDHGETVGSFTVYDTPGHTPGHVCYVSEARSLAVLGDMARESDGSLEPSPWIISWDVEENRRSIEEFADWIGDVDVVAVGHGVPFQSGGGERIRELAASI